MKTLKNKVVNLLVLGIIIGLTGCASVTQWSHP